MGPPETEPSGLWRRYFTPRVHSTSLVDMDSRPGDHQPERRPGTADADRHRDPADVADTHGPGDRGSHGTEMRDLTRRLRVVVVPAHQLAAPAEKRGRSESPGTG
jgi:hypothetical protein